MARYRPTAVLVLAILHLVGGGVGLVMDICGGAVAAAGSSFSPGAGQSPQAKAQQEFQKRMEQRLDQEIPARTAITYASLAVNLLLDILLLAGGLGLLSMQPWARTVSLVYAVLSILTKVFTLANLAFSWPVINRFLEEEAAKNPNLGPITSMMPAILGLTAVFTFLLMIYPIVVLIVLRRPSVAAAFRADARPNEPAEPPDFLDAERPFRPGEPPSDAFTR
ncbi:MAG TPA: hypothetical protein VFE78_17145 [Gemmataceae bacterium]|jgi:hypothetical protein|nr:hypothetical protein [Gemmataceae bacterium]